MGIGMSGGAVESISNGAPAERAGLGVGDELMKVGSCMSVREVRVIEN